MQIPFQFGLPQVLLLLIGIVGLWLCLTACLGLLRPQKSLSEGEKEYYHRTGLVPRRHFKVIRAVSGLLLLAVAVSLLWLMILVQSYLGLTGEIKVAHIQAIPIANAAHQMSVQVVLYDGNGQIASENTYLLQGDEWMMQGDIDSNFRPGST